jgi:hypothetical protein
MPLVHALRCHADARAHRDAFARGERQADRDSGANTGAHTDRNTDAVQPGASGLPHGTAPADCRADTHTEGDADCGWHHSDASTDRDTDAGADDATELNATADRDTHAQLRLTLP